MTCRNNNRQPQTRVRARVYDPHAFLLQSAPAADEEPTDEEERIEREQLREFRYFLLALVRNVVDSLVGEGNTAMYVLSERGESLREIAEGFNCSHETVRRKLRKMKHHLDGL